ncbi:1-acyl-sn-glycerol-3-phosphate acyltransferase [Actinopolyspora alba]|uniref:1-acyl-sn-glycerol-3-phosphate acyltransferase n=1 Tax=Actinopolyspora alba TaxID=673379 RepID=A0A1I1WGN4_9ACTN|nr:lysophospholipid acyltransferase family protein [Actinopolyspora alba]SFD94139.1 1-acyl-sn-glycerol-3-phosphate acyltransferase [Actinopolyspora alba]
MADARVIPLHPEDDGGGRAGAGSQGRSAGDGRSAMSGAPGSARERPAARDDSARDAAAGDSGARDDDDGDHGAGGGEDAEEGTDGGPDWHETLADLTAFARRRLLGQYRVDEFGFDRELTERFFLPLLRTVYDNWFRVEAVGLHNVPHDSGALVVANHSGTLPWDALMTTVALHDYHPTGRQLRMLGADVVFGTPLVGALARKTGQTLACNPDAERLLRGGEIVGVWPEGFKGIGKPFRDRYKLQRFGRGGFVSAAMRSGVPIVPCSIVGAEEIYPKIGDIRPLARLLGLPYFPVTPFFPHLGPLGTVPLPSKWYIEFGEPIDTAEHGPEAAEDPMVVFNISDQVRETIQETIYRLLAQRRTVFFG